MKFTFDALLVLDTINREGSFAAAAETLHRVPSAITYTVKKLEQDLSIELFDRRGHKATLTEAGQTLLKEGRQLINAGYDLENKVKKVADGWETELTLAVSGILPCSKLLPVIERFYQQQSSIRIKLLHEVYGGLWDALVSKRADLAIGAPAEGPAGGGYHTRKLCDIDWIFAVAKQHPLASEKEPLSEHLISKYRVIAVADTSQNLPPRTAGIYSGQHIFSVADLQTKIAAHIQGLGVGFLPRYVIQDELSKGILVEKQVETGTSSTSTYLAWRTGKIGRSLQWFLDRIDHNIFQCTKPN